MNTIELWPTKIFTFEKFLPKKKFKEILNADLHGQQHVTFPFLETTIKKSFYQIFEKEIVEKKLDIEITEIWNNIKKHSVPHSPHCHANNDYSGIFYITRGSATNFLDPRLQAVNFDLGYNQSVARINAVPNKCVFFPSWLIHWVDANMTDTITDSTYRKTIAFNIKFRGNIGKKGSLTEVLV